MVSEYDMVRAMLEQALAEARTRGADRVTKLYLELYDSSPETEASFLKLLREASANTPVENAQVVIRRVPSRFVCWNCCGLRYEGDNSDGICPNCGHEGLLIPADITFALDHIEVG